MVAQFQGVSKVLGKLHLGFLALDVPCLLLCCLFAFLRVLLQPWPCVFLEGLSYLHEQFSESSAEKQLFFSWEQPGTTSV